MESHLNTYNEIVVKSILADNIFGIENVIDIEDINSIYFVKKEYSQIEELIRKCDIDVLKRLSVNQNEASGYLDIIKFKDQSENYYIATIYDSAELSQDPQLIEIYPLLNNQDSQ
ncbi:MAG: hypothetical protein HEQ40_14490 [Lacibacter sp.]|jgi:hypothetical protein